MGVGRQIIKYIFMQTYSNTLLLNIAVSRLLEKRINSRVTTRITKVVVYIPEAELGQN